MESLQQRIDTIVLKGLAGKLSPWDSMQLVDRIMVEFENEFAYRKTQEGTTDKSTKEPELPL
jgi:hypothetical protein